MIQKLNSKKEPDARTPADSEQGSTQHKDLRKFLNLYFVFYWHLKTS